MVDKEFDLAKHLKHITDMNFALGQKYGYGQGRRDEAAGRPWDEKIKHGPSKCREEREGAE